MKNIKNIALATLTALATLAPAANAKFEDKHGNVFYEPSDFGGVHATLVDRLYEVGIPVVDGRGTNLCQNENTLGWYTGEGNFMVICNGDYNTRAETLTHEAVHVVQDCRAGLNNVDMENPTLDSFRFFVDKLGERKSNWIANTYDKEDWATEVEAFYYETRPSAVTDDVERACGLNHYQAGNN